MRNEKREKIRLSRSSLLYTRYLSMPPFLPARRKGGIETTISRGALWFRASQPGLTPVEPVSDCSD